MSKNNFTREQLKIRNNYKKKYGKEMPNPLPLKDKWNKEELKPENINKQKDAK